MCILAISGCSSIPHVERLARSTLHAFMQARLTRNDDQVRSFLARVYHQQYATLDAAMLIGDSEPHYHRYRLLEFERTNTDAWSATVRIEVHARGFYPIGWFTEVIELAPMNGEWQITQVTQKEKLTYTDVAR
jgi:hypothetical protein